MRRSTTEVIARRRSRRGNPGAMCYRRDAEGSIRPGVPKSVDEKQDYV